MSFIVVAVALKRMEVITAILLFGVDSVAAYKKESVFIEEGLKT